jgi:hypothetical protein
VVNSHAADGAGLTLSTEEADAVAAAASGYAAVLPPDRAVAYHALARAAADGVIPDDLVDAAERVAAVSLQTGRARRDGQAGDESLLAAVYRRTPAGQALTGRAREVNQALEALTGRQLRTARVFASAPGSYSLTLEAGGVAVTLAIDTAGIEVRSLRTG